MNERRKKGDEATHRVSQEEDRNSLKRNRVPSSETDLRVSSSEAELRVLYGFDVSHDGFDVVVHPRRKRGRNLKLGKGRLG
jgi:hypothetical protein